MAMSSEHAHRVDDVEAIATFSELLHKVEAGEEFTITKGGLPIAKLVPLRKKFTFLERKEAIERIKKLSRGVSLDGCSIRAMIQEGRR